MAVNSSLESNRVQEIDQLLTLLHPRILQYVASADVGSSQYAHGSLGTYHEPQELKQIFTGEEGILEKGLQHDQKRLFQNIDNVLKYSVNTWNPGFLDKLYASNNPIGVVGDIILSLLNTNSHVYTVSPVVSVIENYVGKKYASMFFPQKSATCGGLTFSGGLWSNITAMHMARSLRFPETKRLGNGAYKFAVFASKHCHYSVEKAAILLGLGSDSVFKIAINCDGTIHTPLLDEAITKAKNDGYTPLFINATAGTTVFGLYDDLQAVSAIAKKHNVWFHIDGSWGGNVVFSEKQIYRLKGCELADSITTNPHKMLGVPNTCLFLLVPNVKNFQTANSLSAPYLFHGRESDDENMDLADGTMGCGRRPDAFKFYLTWLYYGTEGLRQRVDHAYAIVSDFVAKISKIEGFQLVQAEPQCLQVCFYYVPAKFTGTNYTPMTRYVSRDLHHQGKYLMDFSPNPADDKHGEFFRVVFNLPILTDSVVDDLIQSIIDAAEKADFTE
ncbi:glutamate decarboxylase [Metschnikowia aff. pulcherrima]|uniref:Glutamate decarboxylase n=1 Tax=Metschnikowia aff. pulcherrima TaxID=2163413 RepID=A0A4P6XLE3_9ASCO|nr:glutamate decarboxylase [Metschnikowia aff. pulcherrima]